MASIFISPANISSITASCLPGLLHHFFDEAVDQVPGALFAFVGEDGKGKPLAVFGPAIAAQGPGQPIYTTDTSPGSFCFSELISPSCL